MVGSGVAGLGAAWLLSRQHEVVLFESGSYLGGHTHTHDIEIDGRNYAVDTGFIVFNESNYPLLTRMFAELEVASQPTTMSFSVHDEATGFQYNAGTLGGLLAQPSNLLRSRFWRMLRDLRRFYREAPLVLRDPSLDTTLGTYLAHHGYSDVFRDDHIVPMASALWSSPSATILQFPMSHLVRFMANHHMLQVSQRPEWRVVQGGSSSYVHALRKAWSVEERLDSPVQGVRRLGHGVAVTSAAGEEAFDQIVLACHADDALRLLEEPSEQELAILGGITYQDNSATLHTDARVLPPRRRAWAAWNAHVPATAGATCSVSYWMNELQSLAAPEELIVSLNRDSDIDPSRVLRRLQYRHPHQTVASVASQARKAEIQGVNNTWFAGAGWGHGFHEDGLRSGVEVAQQLGVAWP